MLGSLTNLFIAILGLGVLIFVHELGHFIAARLTGVGVHRFSIGFGPATPIRFRRGVTEYVVAWIPLGGYVKMASKEEQQEMERLEGGPVDHEFPPEQLFENKSILARAFVLLAGVIMNVLTAWALYAGIVGIYGRSELATTTLDRVEVAQLPDGAEDLAGVAEGSTLVRVGNHDVATWNDVLEAIVEAPEGPLAFAFAGGDSRTVTLGPGEEPRQALASALVYRVEARIGEVAPGEPAALAGIEAQDLVVAVDGDAIDGWMNLVEVLRASPGKPLAVTVERDSGRQTLTLTPKSVEGTDPQTGESITFGQVGIFQELPTVEFDVGLGEALSEGWSRTWRTGMLVVEVVRGLIFGEISARELGGPIAIAQVSSQALDRGMRYFLGILAYLSVNLAILNLLPIPALDGGQLVFLAAEAVRGGKPLPLEWRYRLLNIGVLLLLALMVFVFGNDIFRIVFGR